MDSSNALSIGQPLSCLFPRFFFSFNYDQSFSLGLEIIDAKLVFMLLRRMSHALLVYLYKTFCSEQHMLKDEINPIRFCLYRTFLFDVWCKINSDSRPRNFKPC